MIIWIELWRTLNANILQYLSSIYETTIVPMTITNLNYFNEITKGIEKSGIEIKHFILSATKENIINRLDSRKNSTEWSYKQVDRCIKSFCYVFLSILLEKLFFFQTFETINIISF